MTLVIKSDHRLLPCYLKYHARLFRIQHHRERDASLHQLLYYPGSGLSKEKKKFVCVCLLQVGQALAMRCRCRAPDFDITGRNIKSDICLLKKFSVCAVYHEKKKNIYICGSLATIVTVYIYIILYNIYIHVSSFFMHPRFWNDVQRRSRNTLR